VTADDGLLDLQEGMSRCGMPYEELWLRQIALGGVAGRLEVEAYVLGLLAADPFQHDVLAQALNEQFLERGENHRVRYSNTAAAE
jgi:hypothetical protein